jgi:hypothetical protein
MYQHTFLINSIKGLLLMAPSKSKTVPAGIDGALHDHI